MPEDDTMREVDDQEDRDADISGHEAANGPFLRPEDIETVDEAEKREAAEGNVRPIWLQPGVVR